MANLTEEDKLRLFQNILAQSPEGLNDPNLIGKFAKAQFDLHRMNSMDEINKMNPPTSPVQAPQSNNSPQMGDSATSDQLGQNSGLNDQNGQSADMSQGQSQPTQGAYDNL
jgi:hypothetical protein